ncbi:MAG: CapA family protein [Pirellulales bacterium]|nr:CapA family protein [Pirellulales bacterium]
MVCEPDCSPTKAKELSLLFCGDAFLRTRNGDDPFAIINKGIDGYMTCINCETSLEGGRYTDKNVTLSVDENTLDCIPQNVSLVSIVNNHMSDRSDPADLALALRQRGKIVIGPDNPARMSTEIKSLSFEFFSAYFSLPIIRLSFNGPLARRLEKMVRDSNAQRRVVNLHWGYEHTDAPAPFQRDLARRLVDAGANLIIGHHPHVPQGWEVYRDATIFYSLGNFNFWQFDKKPSENNKWGYMVRYDPQNGRAEPVPYRINDNYQPFAATGHDKDELLNRLENLCHIVQSIETTTWFSDHYAKWYSHEYKVWKKQCVKTKSPTLMLKFLIWLFLPMQIRYYINHA